MLKVSLVLLEPAGDPRHHGPPQPHQALSRFQGVFSGVLIMKIVVAVMMMMLVTMVTINLSGLFLRLVGVLNFWKGILLLQISIILDPSTLLQHKSENATQGKYPLHLPAGNMIALLLVLSS